MAEEFDFDKALDAQMRANEEAASERLAWPRKPAVIYLPDQSGGDAPAAQNLGGDEMMEARAEANHAPQSEQRNAPLREDEIASVYEASGEAVEPRQEDGPKMPPGVTVDGPLSAHVSAAFEMARGDPVAAFLGSILGGDAVTAIKPVEGVEQGTDGPTEDAPDWRLGLVLRAPLEVIERTEETPKRELSDYPIWGSAECDRLVAEARKEVTEKFVYWPGRSGFVNRINPTAEGVARDKDFDRLVKARHGVQYREKANSNSVQTWYPSANELLSWHYDEGWAGLDVIEGLEFAPGQARIFTEAAELGGRTMLNLWTPPKRCESVGLGSARLLEDHAAYLCNGDKVATNHLLDWIAHLVQKPGERVNHAVLITSAAQGVGKSMFGVAVGLLTGKSNHTRMDTAILKSGFDGLLAGKLVVQVDEVYEAGNYALANALKPKVTEGDLPINVKYGAQIVVRNFARWLMFSNHTANPLALESGDRRFFVIECKQQPKGPAYYAMLDREMMSEAGIEGVRRWLMRRDLSRFNPKAPPPMTQAKAAVIEASGNPLVDYLRSALEDGSLRAELGLRVSEDGRFSFAALQDALRKTNFAQHAKNVAELSAAMQGAGFEQHRSKAGRWWQFPTVDTAGVADGETSGPETSATKSVVTRRVLSPAEAAEWEVAGKPRNWPR
jgi:hypothetical protein